MSKNHFLLYKLFIFFLISFSCSSKALQSKAQFISLDFDSYKIYPYGQNFLPPTIIKYEKGSLNKIRPLLTVEALKQYLSPIDSPLLKLTDDYTISSKLIVNQINSSGSASGEASNTLFGISLGFNRSLVKTAILCIYKGRSKRISISSGAGFYSISDKIGIKRWNDIKTLIPDKDTFSVLTEVVYCDSGFLFFSSKTAAQIRSEFNAKQSTTAFQSQIEYIRKKFSLNETNYRGQYIGYNSEEHSLSTIIAHIDTATIPSKAAVDVQRITDSLCQSGNYDACLQCSRLFMDPNPNYLSRSYQDLAVAFQSLSEAKAVAHSIPSIDSINYPPALARIKEAQSRCDSALNYLRLSKRSFGRCW